MMLLFFDTETSGLPQDWSAPAADVANWPRLVQIGWLCCDDSGQMLQSQQYLIKPQGFQISKAAVAVHGITTARALCDGVDLAPVLVQFSDDLRKVGSLVAHNLDFDRRILQAEFIRAGLADAFEGRKGRCTMKESADFCQLPGKRGWKWPTLTELHCRLFGQPPETVHGALADAEACMQCFFELRRRRVLK
ncbi:MAG: 3'-5' exonuclease [Candidatus Anammoximicrobium sp.]|nr:3'-5' exonuclease [Candidatus Anammoximicrobium sp.]